MKGYLKWSTSHSLAARTPPRWRALTRKSPGRDVRVDPDGRRPLKPHERKVGMSFVGVSAEPQPDRENVARFSSTCSRQRNFRFAHDATNESIRRVRRWGIADTQPRPDVPQRLIELRKVLASKPIESIADVRVVKISGIATQEATLGG